MVENKMVVQLFFFVSLLSMCCFASSLNQEIIAVREDGIKLPPQKLIGGFLASTGDFPYQGLVLRSNSTSRSALCGCVLIDRRWVLTSARCVDDERSYQLEVLLGTTQLSTTNAEVRSVFEIYKHPGFAQTTFGLLNDISLLRISPVRYSRVIQPICLPRSNLVLEEADGSLCTFSGWGVTRENGTRLSQNLQRATAPIVNNAVCEFWHDGSVHILNQHICAGFENGNGGFCDGDVGGPLACPYNNRGGRVLVGIASFVENGCGRYRSPGIYTRVTSYLNWINDTIKSEPFLTRLRYSNCDQIIGVGNDGNGATQSKISVVLLIFICLTSIANSVFR